MQGPRASLVPIRRDAIGLLVPCEVGWVSEEIGYGVFAKHDIPSNCLLWKASPQNTRTFTATEFIRHIESLRSRANRVRLLHNTYGWRGLMWLPLDDSVYWNHSGTPNTMPGELETDDDAYAARDIQRGEELVCNYLEFEYPHWLLDLYRRYDIDTTFIWKATGPAP
jgi:SET domain-containing protein